MNRQLKVILWNAAGLRDKRNELHVFATDHDADVLLITETHLQAGQVCNLPGYQVYRADRAPPLRLGWGGSAIYVHRRLTHRAVALNTTLEAAGVALHAEGRELHIFAAYVAPGGTFAPRDLDHLLDQGPAVIVGGDLNAKHASWRSRQSNTRGNKLRAHLNRRADTDVIAPEHPTHYPTRYDCMPDILDFFLCKGLQRFGMIDVCVFDELSSDHNPVVATLDMAPVSGVPRDGKKFRTDWAQYAAFLDQRLEPAAADSPAALDAQIADLHGVLTDALQASRVPATPWATGPALPADIRQEISSRRRLRRVWQRTRNPAARRAFNQQCEVVKTLLVEWRTTTWTTYLSSLDTEDGSAWRTAKTLRREKASNHPLQGQRGLVYTSSAKAEAFADTMEQQFQPHPAIYDEDHAAHVEDAIDEFFMTPPDNVIQPFTEGEVRAAVFGAKQRKAPGFDGVGAKALQAAPPELLVCLTFIFNAVLRLRHFPTTWKEAKVVMIPKPGKPRHLPENFRPISLLPAISKLFERLFLSRLTPYLEGFIRPEQFGFRRGHSTTLQLTRVVNKLVDNANGYFCSVAVLLDVSKAFDRVWHEGLIYKLIQSPLPASAVHLLKSYLSSRTFRISVEGELSTMRSIQAGVPQGSVLGPVLYLVYTNDMPVVAGNMLSLYADDAMFISRSMNLTRARDIMQLQMDNLSPWLVKWRVAINTDKSNAVVFHKRRHMPRARPAQVTLDGQPITWTTTVKYLGVRLDAKLNFGAHARAKLDEARSLRGFLIPLLGRCSALPVRVKTLLFIMVVRAAMMYASTAWWALCSPTNRKRLQAFQNRTLRAICKQPWFVRNSVIRDTLQVPTLGEFAYTTAENLLRKTLESEFQHIRKIAERDGPPETYRRRPAAILDDPP